MTPDKEVEEILVEICPFYNVRQRKCDNNGNAGHSCPNEYNYASCFLFREHIAEESGKMNAGWKFKGGQEKFPTAKELLDIQNQINVRRLKS